jgi:protein SCO1
MILRRALQILTGTLLGLAVVAVLFWMVPEADDRARLDPTGSAHADPYPAPELSLPGIHGEPVNLENHRGEVVLVFFGFANCPDVCPLTLARWTRALEALEARGDFFQGVFVSVDPGRDTPEALERWMTAFHPSFLTATGTTDQIAATARAWNVHVRVHDGGEAVDHDPHAHHRDAAGVGDDLPPLPPSPGGAEEDYLVEHSSRTFVLDREGQVVQTFPAFLEAEEIVALLEPMMAR